MFIVIRRVHDTGWPVGELIERIAFLQSQDASTLGMGCDRGLAPSHLPF